MMRTKKQQQLRFAAGALGVAAMAVLGIASVCANPPTTGVLARAHPVGGPSYVAPHVPTMQLGQTEGEPTSTVAQAQR